MKLVQLAAAVAFAVTAVKGVDISPAVQPSDCHFRDTSNPEVNVWMEKYQEGGCAGEDGSGGHRIHHGKCQNFDYPFSSFRYAIDPGKFGDDNDWVDCRCYLIAYPERDCTGMPYCMGPVVDADQECADIGDGMKGQSAMVHCDNGAGTMQRDACMQSPLLRYMWGNW